MTPEDQLKFDEYAIQETGKARTQSLIQHINQVCRKKCRNLGDVELCAERYLDMMQYISEKGLQSSK